jgi:hypothetical protein
MVTRLLEAGLQTLLHQSAFVKPFFFVIVKNFLFATRGKQSAAKSAGIQKLQRTLFRTASKTRL